MAKFIKYIALTKTAYGKQKYPTYVITVPMKAVRDMGLENDHCVQIEYDDDKKVLVIKKIKEQ